MARQPNYDPDLFKDSTMSFGEHLEELRACLWRALIGVVVGFLIGLWVGDHVVALIQSPLESALRKYYQAETLDAGQRMLASRGAGDDEALLTNEDLDELVWQQGLVFEEVYIEPRELFDQLRQAYPAQFGDVRLPTNAAGHAPSVEGPTRFVPSDLLRPREFSAQLVQASETAQPSVGLRLWEQLSTGSRDRLRTMVASSTVDAEAQSFLADMLNATIARADFFDASLASAVSLGPEARRLAARGETLSVSQRLRLHRLVLEAAFPEDIAASHPSLLSFFLWRSIQGDSRVQADSFNPQEAFMIYIKAALITGVVISSPWVFWQIWMFVAAGLYPHERHYVNIFLPFSLGLFLAGASLAFFFVFEPVLTFLFGFNRWLGINPTPRISEWLSFVLLLPVGFGLSFQLPLVMLFLERVGIFTVKMYVEKWRIAILAIFVISSVLTPADPYSMMLMAIPLTGLYFGGVLLCRTWPRSEPPIETV